MKITFKNPKDKKEHIVKKVKTIVIKNGLMEFTKIGGKSATVYGYISLNITIEEDDIIIKTRPQATTCKAHK